MSWWKLRTKKPVRVSESKPTGAQLDEPTYDLGTCCACGQAGPAVRNILMLPRRGPTPDHGWGCAVCGLATEGAMSVLCDACLEAHAPLKWACLGYVTEPGRVPIAELCEPWEHNLVRHNLLEAER